MHFPCWGPLSFSVGLLASFIDRNCAVRHRRAWGRARSTNASTGAKTPSSAPSGHLLPVSTGRRENGGAALIFLLAPRQRGEGGAKHRVRGIPPRGTTIH